MVRVEERGMVRVEERGMVRVEEIGREVQEVHKVQGAGGWERKGDGEE